MWSPCTRSEILKGPLVTLGLKFSGDLAMSAGLSEWKTFAGTTLEAPSAKAAMPATNGFLNESLTVESSTLVALTNPMGSDGSVVGKPKVLANAGVAYRLKLKATSSAVSGEPSDHLRPECRWTVSVFRSDEM